MFFENRYTVRQPRACLACSRRAVARVQECLFLDDCEQVRWVSSTPASSLRTAGQPLEHERQERAPMRMQPLLRYRPDLEGALLQVRSYQAPRQLNAGWQMGTGSSQCRSTGIAGCAQHCTAPSLIEAPLCQAVEAHTVAAIDHLTTPSAGKHVRSLQVRFHQQLEDHLQGAPDGARDGDAPPAGKQGSQFAHRKWRRPQRARSEQPMPALTGWNFRPGTVICYQVLSLH